MTDSSHGDVARDLRTWAIKEMHFRPQGRFSGSKLPTEQDFKELCRGQMIDIWKFVLANVHSTQKVKKIKGNLALKGQLNSGSYTVKYEGKEKYSEERARLEERRATLSGEVTHLLTDMGHLENDHSRLQREVMDTEASMKESSGVVRDTQRKAAMLKIFSQKCSEQAAQFDEYSNRISAQVDKISCRTGNVSGGEMYYAKGTKEGLSGSESEIETACGRDVRESCEKIGAFLHEVLQGSFGSNPTVFHQKKEPLWTSVEKVLSSYPVGQVLQALIVNTQDSVLHVHEKTTNVDIRKDAEKLQFKYEKSGMLVDMSPSPVLLPGVHHLQEVCQTAHIRRFFDAEKHRNETYKMRPILLELRNKVLAKLEKRYKGKAGELELCRKVVDIRAQLASMKAVLQTLREEQTSLQASVRKAGKLRERLLVKHRKIQDFAALAEKKQKLIHVLVRQNSNSFSRLSTQRDEIVRYIERSLSNHEGEIGALVGQAQGGVIQEVEKFASLHLPFLMYTWLDSACKVAVLDMAIHHINKGSSTTAGQTIHQVLSTIGYPLFKGPEYVLSRCLEIKTEIEEVEFLLQSHSAMKQKLVLQTPEGSTDPVAYITELCEKVREHDRLQLDKIVPLLHQRINKAAKGLTDCLHYKDTVQVWWEQPGQLCAPWIQYEHMNLQQWRDTWTVAATRLRQAHTLT